MTNCRLQIWIKGKPILQGKIYKLDEKWVFLANIDSHKLWRNYNGYSIATQILEAFQDLKIKPLILFKNIENKQVLQAIPSDFYKSGIPVSYGNHRQMVLPVIKWKFFKGDLQEPFNLPAKTVDEWKKPNTEPRNFSIQPSIFQQIKERNPGLVASLGV